MPSKAKITLGFKNKRIVNRIHSKAERRGLKPAQILEQVEKQLSDGDIISSPETIIIEANWKKTDAAIVDLAK